MPKVLCFLGMAVSAVLLIIFGLDLAAGTPFNKQSMMMDIGFIFGAAVLGFLSWTTFREQI